MLKKSVSSKTPRNLLFLFELLSLMLIFLYQWDSVDNSTYITGFGLVIAVYLSNILLMKISNGDHYILLISTMLISIGAIMIYRIDSQLGLRQLIWIVIGISIFFATYLIFKIIKKWHKLALLYVGTAYFLFAITFIFGERIYGAINWIAVAGVSLQPAEITKILVIFIVASYYGNIDKFKDKSKYSSLILMAIMYSFVGLLFIQRDLGASLIFYGIFLGLQFIYEPNRKLILLNIGLFSISGILGYILFNHVQVRFQSWIDPWTYIDTQGYQITQSLFAMAEGGFFGTGLGLGNPEFIPLAYTDFIFPAIIEEMGVFTGIGIIMLFMIMVYRGFKIALGQRIKFYRIMALGISILFAIQSIIILGGVMKVIPLTGITLPFVSYGGSSIISSFIALGILQVASEEIKFEEENNDQ